VALAVPAGAAGASAPGVLSQSLFSGGCTTNSGSPLTNCFPNGRAMADMRSAVVSPDGRNLYTSSTDEDAVAIFDRDLEQGTVAQKPGAAGCIVNGPSTDVANCDNSARAIDGEGQLAISPDGENVYVATDASHAVAVFDRDTLTGVLTQKVGAAGCIVDGPSPDIATCDNTGRGLGGAVAISVSSDGKSVYVAASASDAVAVFDRDATSGALTQRAGAEGCTVNEPSADIATCNNTARALDQPRGVVVSPDREVVYVTAFASDAIAAFDRNTGNGALTQKANAEGCIVDGPATDVATCDNGGRALNGPRDLTLSPDGRNAYAAVEGSSAIAAFDLSGFTGTPTQKADAAGCLVNAPSPDVATCDHTARALTGAAGVAVSPDGSNVYVTAVTSDAVATFDRATPAGALTQKAGAAGCLVNGASTDIATCANNGRGLNTADAVVVSPDGTSAYVVAQTGALAILGRDLVPACRGSSGATALHNQTTPISLDDTCSDPDGDSINLVIVTAPTHGAAIISQGQLLYTPNAGYSGSDSLTYKATTSFPTSTESDPVSVFITVLPGQAPVCAPQARTVGQNTETTLALACAAGGDPFTYVIETGPTHGALDPVVQTTGFVDYTPATGFSGSDSFTYKATSAFGISAVMPYSLSVLPTQQGAPGTDGTDGTNGADGAQGPTGAAGQQGPPGADGARGPAGPQGPGGPAGAQGPPAFKLVVALFSRNLKGVAGKRVRLGYVSTLAASAQLDVLKGAKRVARARGRARVGANTIAWNGRIGRKLAKPGLYRLRLTAVNGSQKATQTATLRVRRR
jgi:DNA-binding beta-propeller fold protein YncE